jgi:hypothetical protein
MRFSVSVLTTTALCKALVSVLAQRYHYESEWNGFFNYARSTDGDRRRIKIAKRFEIAASEDADGVILDIESVIGVSEVSDLLLQGIVFIAFLG